MQNWRTFSLFCFAPPLKREPTIQIQITQLSDLLPKTPGYGHNNITAILFPFFFF